MSNCTFEFKSNFEFKWTPTHPLSTKGMRHGLNYAWSDFMRNLFSCNKWDVKKRDKVQRLIAHSNSNFILNLNGQLIILIHSFGALK